MQNYGATLQSFQHALPIRIKLFGEENESTAESYRDLGVTQHNVGEYSADLQSYHHTLAILIKLLGEEHESNDESYKYFGVTQHNVDDYMQTTAKLYNLTSMQ